MKKNPMSESHAFPSDLDRRTYLDYLRFVVKRIHTVVVATVDDADHPVTAAIDMMDCDEDGLLFLTARGKGFYRRLAERRYLALTGMLGASTMERVAVSVAGEVCEEGPQLLPRLFERNPYMLDIYPNEEARRSLTVMRLWRGSGEWFDLSKHPIERASFCLGRRGRRNRPRALPHHRRLHRVRGMYEGLPAGLHRAGQGAGRPLRHRAGPLPALRGLPGGVPRRCGGAPGVEASGYPLDKTATFSTDGPS